MTLIELAKQTRGIIETAAESLDDAMASQAPTIFRGLKGDGTLVKAGTRICWHGVVKRAALDLWDSPENTPDNAPNLWEDLMYKGGIRIIPDVITTGTAFALGEKGWWNDVLYESIFDGQNVWSPDAYPDGWAVYTDT